MAGVSTASVSRTLSNPDLVAEKTRNAVLEAVKATGYRVNRAARSLRTQRSNTILALLPDLGNPFFSQILQGIVSVLTPAGYSLLVAETKQIVATGDTVPSYFDDGRADGMIVMDGSLGAETIEALHATPQDHAVVFACEWVNGAAFPSVRSGNRRGAEAAVQHLYDLGHRHIAHVAGPEGNVLTEARRDAFVEATNRLGCAPRLEWVMAGAFNLNAGREAARDLLALAHRPTAVFCASDEIAYGLISELRRNKVDVPGEISVVGFDDIELSEHYVPALTTMRQDRLLLGRRAAEMLMERMRSKQAGDMREILVTPIELVARDSTGPVAT